MPGTGGRDLYAYTSHTQAADILVQPLHLCLCCSPPSMPTFRFSVPLILLYFHDPKDVPRLP